MDKMNQPIKSCLWGIIGLLQVISLGAQEPYSRKHHVSVGGMVEGAYLLSRGIYTQPWSPLLWVERAFAVYPPGWRCLR